MVNFAPVFGAAALFASLVSAAPRPDSAIGDEVAVSAPNGVILSDTAALASRHAETAAASSTQGGYYAPATTTAASDKGYGYGGYDSSASSSSEAKAYETSSAAYDNSYSSSSAYDNAYTSTAEATSSEDKSYYTATSSAMSSQMTYGSGSSNWGGSGYDSCVQQCVASYGAPPATWTPPPSKTDSGSSSGTGVTHTVIVAPTQGVLRYVPFAVNASVGDTVHFVWMANNHTVTKSSELELCNKTSDKPFISGTHDKGFTFDQVVNDTNPTFYYCGTPGHCQKGMFGMINPPSAAGAATSVQQMMPSLVSNNSDLSAMWSYMNNMTKGNLAATQWGNNIDMAKVPEWAHGPLMENVMYGRTFFAENPEILGADGKVDMSANGNPIKFPMDITAALNNAAAGSASTPAASGSATASSAASTGSSTAAPANAAANGASSTFASSALVSVAVFAATFFML